MTEVIICFLLLEQNQLGPADGNLMQLDRSSLHSVRCGNLDLMDDSLVPS